MKFKLLQGPTSTCLQVTRSISARVVGLFLQFLLVAFFLTSGNFGVAGTQTPPQTQTQTPSPLPTQFQNPNQIKDFRFSPGGCSWGTQGKTLLNPEKQTAIEMEMRSILSSRPEWKISNSVSSAARTGSKLNLRICYESKLNLHHPEFVRRQELFLSMVSHPNPISRPLSLEFKAFDVTQSSFQDCDAIIRFARGRMGNEDFKLKSLDGESVWSVISGFLYQDSKEKETLPVIALDPSLSLGLKEGDTSSDVEVSRLILHELGHLLGFEHHRVVSSWRKYQGFSIMGEYGDTDDFEYWEQFKGKLIRQLPKTFDLWNPSQVFTFRSRIHQLAKAQRLFPRNLSDLVPKLLDLEVLCLYPGEFFYLVSTPATLTPTHGSSGPQQLSFDAAPILVTKGLKTNSRESAIESDFQLVDHQVVKSEDQIVYLLKIKSPSSPTNPRVVSAKIDFPWFPKMYSLVLPVTIRVTEDLSGCAAYHRL